MPDITDVTQVHTSSRIARARSESLFGAYTYLGAYDLGDNASAPAIFFRTETEQEPGPSRRPMVGDVPPDVEHRRQLNRAVVALRPAEERFLELISRLGDDEDAWDWAADRPYRTEAPRDPSFVDPSVLA